MTLTLEEHNAKVEALKAAYDAKVEACKDAEADYNEWFAEMEAKSKEGEELQKIRDAAWQSRCDAFDALMFAKEERSDATEAHFAVTKADA